MCCVAVMRGLVTHLRLYALFRDYLEVRNRELTKKFNLNHIFEYNNLIDHKTQVQIHQFIVLLALVSCRMLDFNTRNELS